MLEKFYNKFAIIGIFIALVIALLIALFFFTEYQKSQAILNNPSELAKTQAQALINQVSKIMELPADETPTIASVNDKTKLKDQPFFNKALNGDKVLVYTVAKIAILYRPSSNKIIEVAPINVAQNTATATPSATTQSQTATIPVKVALYNGTTAIGITKVMEKDLTDKKAGVSVVVKADAVGNYDQTFVIDLSGQNAQKAQELANLMQGVVGTTFPPKESKPKDADILIIIGKNYVK